MTSRKTLKHPKDNCLQSVTLILTANHLRLHANLKAQNYIIFFYILLLNLLIHLVSHYVYKSNITSRILNNF
jgi:hypothetical protein